MAAASAMFDEVHPPLLQAEYDTNTYTLGRIGLHNVVIAGLPSGEPGINAAGKVAIRMLSSFRRLRFGLMVGVGGGVPSRERDIRLADVAVGLPMEQHGGTVQYDFGKTVQDGKFDRGGTPYKPPSVVLTALTKLRARHMMAGYDLSKHLSHMYAQFPTMASDYARPDSKHDLLYEYDYDHPRGVSDCSQCDQSRIVVREPRSSLIPAIHYGLIASGNQVMRDGMTRESLRRELGAICFEMEGAGPADDLPSLVIRGICDYSDSHKNKHWQPYAAATAACYAKELLNLIPGVQLQGQAGTRNSASAHRLTGSTQSEQSAARLTSSPQALDEPHSHAGPRIFNDYRGSSGNVFFTSADGPLSDGIGLRTAAAPSSDQQSGLPTHSQTTSFENMEFLKGLNQFKLCLKAQQLTSFKTGNIRTLRETLLRIQRDQAARSQSMNLPRVEAFLKSFKQLEQSLEFAETSEFVAYVLGAVKFSLQTASRSRKAFDTLLNAYHNIGELLWFSDSANTWFIDYPQRDFVLVKICGNILQFQQLVLHILGIATWWHVFDNIWKASASRLEFLFDDFRRYRELFKVRACTSDLHDYHQKSQVTAQNLEQSRNLEKKNQWFAVQQWLTGADSQQDHQDVRKVRSEIQQSGEWLRRHPTYVSWKMDDVPKMPILWLSGILGAGKTVLASSVIDDCLEAVDAKIAFFYCKHGDPQRNTSVPILRAMIGQLLSLDNPLLPWCYEQFVGSNQLSLTNEKTCRDILRMILLNASRVFLIIDGIDECARSDRRLLLTFFNQMISECDRQNPGIVRIMFVSRAEDDIRKNLHSFTEIALRSTDHERDVGRYIDAWCRKIRGKFEEVEQNVLDYISASTRYRAEGMFLFAKLVMTNLHKQISLEALLEQIRPEVFPQELGQAYTRIFTRIQNDQNPNEVDIARKILGWMSCARRPLKWNEIQGAISSNIAEGTIDFVRRRSRVHIREICGSLINDLSGDRLELIHGTTKEYLLKSDLIKPAIVECELASLCLSYLTFECFDENLTQEQRTEFVLHGDYALQDYAVTHWCDHTSTTIKAGAFALEAYWKECGEFGSAITNFVACYGPSLQEDAELEEADSHCAQFKGCPFFDDLCRLFMLMNRQFAKGRQGFDDICPKLLEPAIAASRTILEEYSSSPNLDEELKKNLGLFYGTKWYKCPKAACYYFHEGFTDARSKDYHVIRHEHPFRCKFVECEMGYKLGFTSQKLLEKHLVIYHPENDKLVATFSRLKKSRNAGDGSSGRSPSSSASSSRFECPECSRGFTRMSSLNRHILAKAKERPFKCSLCEKRFGQDNDRKRHEKEIHGGEKPFICKGTWENSSGSHNWGCGKAFPRASGLLSHLRSPAGQSCLQPLFDNDKDKDETVPQNRVDLTHGEEPLPREVYEQYPDLRTETPVQSQRSTTATDSPDNIRSPNSQYVYNYHGFKSWPFK